MTSPGRDRSVGGRGNGGYPRGVSAERASPLLVSLAQEFIPEGNHAGTNWQASGPVETVAMPVMVSKEPWMKVYGSD